MINFILRHLWYASILGLMWFSSASTSASPSGESLYQKCIACHSFGYNRTGPDHCGLVGRVAGELNGFEYTDAMRSSKIVWTVENLDRFLAAPLEVVPDTSMGFIGVDDSGQRSKLIAYIQAQKDSPDCN